MATLNAELEDADNSIDKLEAQIANLRVEVSRLQVQNEDLLEVVKTATESAQMSMLREVQVNKDAENIIKEKIEAVDARVREAEFNIEQKYTNLLYEIQDEKEGVEDSLREVEAELTSTRVIVEHKTEANASLTKQVQHLEETKSELEEDLRELEKENNSDVIAELRKDLTESLDRNTEFKDAVARIKWRSKEEIDVANNEVSELKEVLSQMETEQQLVSAELVRVMAERDSLEDEIEDLRLSYDQQEKRNTTCGDISDLDSITESIGAPAVSTPPVGSPSLHALSIRNSHSPLSSIKSSPSPRPPRPLALTPMNSKKSLFSPSKGRHGPSDRSMADDGADSVSHAPASVSLEDHKAKMAEKQAALEDKKRKHFILMEEMENLRKQHTELMENNMLERKNREKLLKAAQKETATIQKEYKQCQKQLAGVEKELSEYLSYHQRQTEIKDTTVAVHKELAKSRAANADLAQQLVESNKIDTTTQQMNTDLQNEVTFLLAEVESLQNELDNPKRTGNRWSSGDSDDSDSDSDSEQDNDDDGLFTNNNSVNPSPRSSTGTLKKNRNQPKHQKTSPLIARTSSGSSSLSNRSASEYDALKLMYLATALDSADKRKRESSTSSPANSTGGARTPNSLSKGKPKIRPRQVNTNLNGHFSPSDSPSSGFK